MYVINLTQMRKTQQENHQTFIVYLLIMKVRLYLLYLLESHLVKITVTIYINLRFEWE